MPVLSRIWEERALQVGVRRIGAPQQELENWCCTKIVEKCPKLFLTLFDDVLTFFTWWTFRPRKKIFWPPPPAHPPTAVVHHPASRPRKPSPPFLIPNRKQAPRTPLPFPRPQNRRKIENIRNVRQVYHAQKLSKNVKICLDTSFGSREILHVWS